MLPVSMTFGSYAKSIIHQHPYLMKLVPKCAFNDKGIVVEVIDNQSVHGNILFTNILAGCILPGEQGGCNSHAIYFDLQQNFDLLQLIGVLEEKTNAGEDLIKEWMKQFHIVRCRDLHQLIITLFSIEPMIANSKIPVKLLVLDGLGCNYWHEQLIGANSKYIKERNYNRLIDTLKSLMVKYGISVLMRTTEVFARKQDGNSSIDYRNTRLFGDAWNNFVTDQFVLIGEHSNEQTFSLKNIHNNQQVRFMTKGNVVT